MISYTKRIVKIGPTRKCLVADFGNGEYAVLTELFTSEVPAFYSQIMSCLNKALSGESEDAMFSGNSCLIHANKDYTTVECMIDEANVGEPCAINTGELKDLITTWYMELSDFA